MRTGITTIFILRAISAFLPIQHGDRGWRRPIPLPAELFAATSGNALNWIAPSVRLLALLQLDADATPQFGMRVRTPLRDAHEDRTEMDMCIGNLMVEAKLSESDFQTARPDLLARYEAFEEVFDVDQLPRSRTLFRSYQLLRGVMATQASDARFAVLIDARRPDLQRQYFAVLAAIRYSHVRSRMMLVTWQEIAAAVPASLQQFLARKYGIFGGRL